MSRSEARGKSHAANGSFQNRADARIGSATGERRASGRAADTHRKSHAVASKTRHGMASCEKKSDGGNELEPSTEQYFHGTPLVRCRQEIFRTETRQPPTSGEPPGTRERSSAVLPGLSQRRCLPVVGGGCLGCSQKRGVGATAPLRAAACCLLCGVPSIAFERVSEKPHHGLA